MQGCDCCHKSLEMQRLKCLLVYVGILEKLSTELGEPKEYKLTASCEVKCWRSAESKDERRDFDIVVIGIFEVL
jgi:hypothetical protein